jgi:hypothetical protein
VVEVSEVNHLTWIDPKDYEDIQEAEQTLIAVVQALADTFKQLRKQYRRQVGRN